MLGFPLLSLSVLLQVPACLPFPISYSMGKGKEEGDRSAQAEDGGGGVSPSHLLIVADVTNTTFICPSSSIKCMTIYCPFWNTKKKKNQAMTCYYSCF